ncbi:MAG: hypothetical protein FWG28_02835 [Clostridiales bacterium]|nr:hypothetical protein [Clostridiales bacterium]
MAIEDVLGSTSTDRMLGATKMYDAVFTDKKENANVKPSDFLNLMVAQMRNQDFMNPMDDSQFVTQMAQFTTMQQMMEMAEWAKSTYALTLVGKTVTASRFNVSGGLDTVTGVVDRISFVDNEYVLYIGDGKWNLNQIMEVHAGTSEADKAKETDPAKGTDPDTDKDYGDASQISLIAGETTQTAAIVAWKAPTEDLAAAAELKYTVYYSLEGPFDTLDEVKNGILAGDENRTGVLADIIVGLDPGTEYFVNVVVLDPNGNESVYQPVMIVTKGDAVGGVGETEPEGEVDGEEPAEPEEVAEGGAAGAEEAAEGDETPEEEEPAAMGQSPITGEEIEQ